MRVPRGEAPLRRVVVVGNGFFGRVIARRLSDEGIRPVVASRARSDMRLDAEDPVSLRGALREGDVIVDTAGPFQFRSTALLEAAIERGCDVIDLSDARTYAEAALALHDRAAASGARILTSCSAIAAVAAAAIHTSGLASPDACDLFLAPASAETGSPATVRAYLASVDWSRRRDFPDGGHAGHRVESAATVLLPRAWPSLRRVDFWVDPNAPFAATTMALACRLGLARMVALAAPLSARLLGRRNGLFSVVARHGARGEVTTLSAPGGSYLIAAEPAVLAAASLARGGDSVPGVVLPNAQLDATTLFGGLRALGLDVRSRPLQSA